MKATFVVAASFVLLAALVAIDGLPYSNEAEVDLVDRTGLHDGDMWAPSTGDVTQQNGYDVSLSELEMNTKADAFIELEARAPPLTMAKAACTAAWTATKTQCNVIQTATVPADGMLALQNTIKAAGAAVLAAVHDTLPAAGGNSTVQAIRASLTEKLLNLGESMDTTDADNAPTQAAAQKTLGHLACQSLWQQVEALCTTGENAAERGKEAVTNAIKKEGDKFKSHAENIVSNNKPAAASASNSTKPAAKPAAKPAPKLMDSQEIKEAMEYREDEFVHSMDNN